MHRHREDVRALVRQHLRYGAGHAWLRRRSRDRGSRSYYLGDVARAVQQSVHGLVMRDADEIAFGGLDMIRSTAMVLGRLGHNRPLWSAACTATQRRPDVLVTWELPDADGNDHTSPNAVFEVAARPRRPRPWLVRSHDVHYWEDDSSFERLVAGLAFAPALVRTCLRRGRRPPVRALGPPLARARHAGSVAALRSIDAPLAEAIRREG
jgi:hypothetical protein